MGVLNTDYMSRESLTYKYVHSAEICCKHITVGLVCREVIRHEQVYIGINVNVIKI